MDKFSIQNIQMIDSLTSELEYEKASTLFLQLRVLVKNNKSYESIRSHLRNLIKNYEKANWSNEDTITDIQIEESDFAEALIQAENKFHQKRKEVIVSKLKEAGLNQSDLARILGHRKGYMSELMNGLRPFSKDDLVVINRLFKIKFEVLIPAFVNQERATYIKNTLESLTSKNVNLTKLGLDLQMA